MTDPAPTLGIDLATAPDQTGYALVYVNADGERITGLTHLAKDDADRLAASFNDFSRKLKGSFEIESDLQRVARRG